MYLKILQNNFFRILSWGGIQLPNGLVLRLKQPRTTRTVQISRTVQNFSTTIPEIQQIISETRGNFLQVFFNCCTFGLQMLIKISFSVFCPHFSKILKQKWHKWGKKSIFLPYSQTLVDTKRWSSTLENWWKLVFIKTYGKLVKTPLPVLLYLLSLVGCN